MADQLLQDYILVFLGLGQGEVGEVFLGFSGHNKFCTAKQLSFEMPL